VPGDDRRARSRLTTFRRRILLAQALYALAAVICLVSTVASVAALALVQLYFIVSPRLPALARGGGGADPETHGDRPV
jgi:TMEM175 potassium channel family protein